MKIALCTTTINMPKVLRWYRACRPDVRFFVTADLKTPNEVYDFAKDLGNAVAYSPTMQEHWKCSAPIGWSTIQRRNIAFLEALKWGADIIVSVDDDNVPLTGNYFIDFAKLFELPFSGVQATATNGFFDIGDFLFPKSKQRGIPFNNTAGLRVESVTGAKIGVAQGLCIGAPDIDAATRFNGGHAVHQVSEVAKAGLVVDRYAPTIWNSQNTAIIRELVPAWGMIPFVGRMDDIYASLICHKVMSARSLYAHYGCPMVYQERNEHRLIKDMRDEIDGYEHVRSLATALDHIQLPGVNVLEDCRRIWDTLAHCDFIPAKSVEAMQAWLDDCEDVL